MGRATLGGLLAAGVVAGVLSSAPALTADSTPTSQDWTGPLVVVAGTDADNTAVRSVGLPRHRASVVGPEAALAATDVEKAVGPLLRGLSRPDEPGTPNRPSDPQAAEEPDAPRGPDEPEEPEGSGGSAGSEGAANGNEPGPSGATSSTGGDTAGPFDALNRPAAAAIVEVTGISAAELRPATELVLDVSVVPGAGLESGLELVASRTSARTATVSALTSWLDPAATLGSAPGELDVSPTPLVELAREPVPATLPGEAVRLRLTLPADTVGLAANELAAGPYGLRLDAVSAGGTVAPETAAGARGFLVWSPDSAAEPTQLATVVQLVSPAPEPETGAPSPSELAESLSTDGRLRQVLDLAGALEASWAIDPLLVASVADLAGPGSRSGTSGSGNEARPVSQDPEGLPPAESVAAAVVAAGGPAGPDLGPGPDASGAFRPRGSEQADSGELTPTPTPTPSGPEEPPTDPSETLDDEQLAGPTRDARRWLDDLADLRGEREVVATAWAYADPTRPTSAQSPAEAQAVSSRARTAALPGDSLARLLAGPVREDLLVAPPGTATEQAVRSSEPDTQGVLLWESDLPLREPLALTFTPDHVAAVAGPDGPLPALVANGRLSRAMTAAAEGDSLALTTVSAILAATTVQRPSDSRVLAAVLPHSLDPDAEASAALARTLQTTSWGRPIGLTPALGTAVPAVERAPLRDSPPSGTDQAAPGDVDALLSALAASRDAASAFRDTVRRRQQADARAAGTLAFHTPAAGIGTQAAVLTQETTVQTAAVTLVPGSRVNLAAREGPLRFTIVNELDSQVELVLRVKASNPRIVVREPETAVQLPAEVRSTVDVPVTAAGTGPAVVTAALFTPEGEPWGTPVELEVNVSPFIESQALVVAAAAVAVAFVVGAARAVRRNRRRAELEEQS